MTHAVVFVRYKRSVGDKDLDALEAHLRDAVAAAFDGAEPDSRMSAGNIDLHFTPMESRGHCDRDIFITVEVNDSQAQRNNYPHSVRQLEEAITAILGSTRFALWPKLVFAQYVAT